MSHFEIRPCDNEGEFLLYDVEWDNVCDRGLTRARADELLALVQKFPEGARVRLKPNEEEGWVEEFATVDGYEGGDCWVVTLESKYWSDTDTDGLREVGTDQFELA